MSGGPSNLLPTRDMAKVGGPTIGSECFRKKMNIPCPHCFSLPLILYILSVTHMQMHTQSYATPDPGFKRCWAYEARATRSPYQEKRASLLSTPAHLYTRSTHLLSIGRSLTLPVLVVLAQMLRPKSHTLLSLKLIISPEAFFTLNNADFRYRINM